MQFFAKVTKWFDTLLVLLWKEMMIRVRSPISTFFELTVHILAYLLFYYLHSQMMNMEQSEVLQVTEHYRVSKLHVPKSSTSGDLLAMRDVESIYYTPPEMSLLMSSVAKKLGINENNVYPYADEVQLLAIRYEELVNDKSNFAVIFDTHNKTLDAIFQLSYKIRNSQAYKIDQIAPEVRNTEPHEQYGSIYESFVAVQMAIDHSFTELKSESELSKTMSFQMFPYKITEEPSAITTSLYERMYPSISINAILLYTALLASRLCSDKTTGIKALVKTANVSSASMYTSSIIAAMLFATPGMIVSAYLIMLTTEHFYDMGILLVTYLLHLLQVSAVAAVCAAVLPKVNMATVVSLIGMIAVHTLLGQVDHVRGFWTWLPNGPIIWFYDVTGHMHMRGQHVGWSQILHTIPGEAGIGAMWLTFLLSCIPLFIIVWYADHVLPGPYGVPERWNFFLTRKFWFGYNGKKIMSQIPVETEEVMQYIEPPVLQPIGVQINNLWKIFPDSKKQDYAAVAGVNLNLYEKEILVLLGQNGAGKTTMMSIITGTQPQSSGTVDFLEDSPDSESDSTSTSSAQVSPETRRHHKRPRIGYCPQQNALINKFTCHDHLYFFAKLHHGVGTPVQSIVEKAAASVRLTGAKMGNRAGVLSGGEKRRLQLGCALASGAHTLILDEPTSGLDPRARRSLWDILLQLRGSHTVLVSTHYMDEADVLADRIAVMRLGHLVCYGTPMFLKKSFNTGYRLTILKVPSCNEQLLQSKVQGTVSGAELVSSTDEQVVFKLPSEMSSSFPDLFNSLEKHKESLGINTIGIGVTTLEEIFLKVAQGHVEPDIGKLTPIEAFPEEVADLSPLTGMRLMGARIKAIISKRLRYERHNMITALVVQVLLPIAIAVFAILFANLQFFTDTPVVNSMMPYMYPHMSKIFYSDNDRTRGPILEQYLKSTAPPGARVIEPVKMQNVTQSLLDLLETDVNTYLDGSLIAAEFDKDNYNGFYSTSVYHAFPVVVNFLNNILAYEEISRGKPQTPLTFPIINTINEPIVTESQPESNNTKSVDEIMMWAFFVSFAFYFILLPWGSLHAQERGGARLLSRMCGISVYFSWLFSWIWEFSFYIIISAVIVLITFFLEDGDTLNAAPFLGSFFGLCAMHGLAASAFIYLLSFLINSSAAISTLYLGVCIVFGPILSLILFGLYLAGEDNGTIPLILKWVSNLTPPYPLTRGLADLGYVAMQNAQCVDLYTRLAPLCNLPRPPVTDEFHIFDCCSSTVDGNGKVHGPHGYFSGKHSATVGEQYIILGVQAVIFMGIVLLLDSIPNGTVWSWIMNISGKRASQPERDELVTAEKEFVKSKIERSGSKTSYAPDSEHTMIISDMHKSYFVPFRKPVHAVKGVSIASKRGECFGLLGVNGAGKSSLLTMLVKLSEPTFGSAWINGYSVKSKPSEYLSQIGYCPQFEALSPYLTGVEQITFLLQLQGVNPRKLPHEVDKWINSLGLQQNKNKISRKYSGGQRRRLSAACALLMAARDVANGKHGIALMDEPTAGVDPAAARQLWTALKLEQEKGASIFLSSHSMHETEILCDRVGIMSQGELVALGSCPGLRSRFSWGYTATLKLASIKLQDIPSGDATPFNMAELREARSKALKEAFPKMFPTAELKDDRQTMLQYRIITRNLTYGDLFLNMEKLKLEFQSVLEDYTVSETTLEEVFLSLSEERNGIV